MSEPLPEESVWSEHKAVVDDRRMRLSTVCIGFVNFLHSRGCTVGEASADHPPGLLEVCDKKRIARLIAEFSANYG